jgi:5-methyltetrahydrofolate--homocysteine methyltransferase
MKSALDDLVKSVVAGDAERALELAGKALAAGASAETVLNEALIPAMDAVGELYEQGEYFLPELMAAASAMQKCMTRLRPELARSNVKPVAKAILGTVKGDLHDIGKKLVGVMLQGAGFEVIDLGADVPAEKFVEAARTKGARLLGLSALLTTTMPAMRTVIEALEASGLRDNLKVMVGGAPLTAAYADAIGADGYAPDAPQGVRTARRLLGLE